MAVQRLVGRAQVIVGPLVPSEDATEASTVPPVAELVVERYAGPVYLHTTSERGQIIARVLDLLVSVGANVYFEIDDHQIIDVSVPIVGGVLEMIESSGDVIIVLRGRPTPMVLRADTPGRDAFLEALAAARSNPRTGRSKKRVAVVTRLPCTNVLFAQTVEPASDERLRPSGDGGGDCDEDDLTAASVDDLDAFVREESAAGCDVRRPRQGCVPHTYICDYCYLRAHEMCLRLQQRGFRPRKLWLWATNETRTLRVPTIFLPDCETNWRFHVVATVRLQEGVRVIDPSLFPDGTVSESDYRDFIRPFIVERTPMAAYEKELGKEYEEVTEFGLNEDRSFALSALVDTLKEPAGSPPYGKCLRPSR